MSYPGYPSEEPSYPPYPSPMGYGMQESAPYQAQGYEPYGAAYPPPPVGGMPGGYPPHYVGGMPGGYPPPPSGMLGGYPSGPPPGMPVMYPPLPTPMYAPGPGYTPGGYAPPMATPYQGNPAMYAAPMGPSAPPPLFDPYPLGNAMAAAAIPVYTDLLKHEEMVHHVTKEVEHEIEKEKEEIKEEEHHEPKHEGTIKPHHPFEPRADAEALKKAMKGLGTNEKAVIEILTNRTCEQRCEIAMHFKSLFGKDLVSALKKELTGDFESAIVALMTPRKLYLARSMHSAIKGNGTKEETLVEILASSCNSEIHDINAAYHEEYNHSLEKDLKGDTSGYFENLLVALDAGNRSDTWIVNREKALADAEALYKSGEKMTGTNESTFTKILVAESYPQLRCVFEEYQKIAHHSIEDALKKEMSGDLLDGMLSIVKCVRCIPEYFAERLQGAMKRAGTHDHTLIRIVVTRSEIDLKSIKKAYEEKYGKSLSKMISSETSGDYKKVLVAVVKE